MKKQLTVLCVGLALGSCRQHADDPAPASASSLVATRWMLVQVDASPIGLSSYYEDSQSYIQFMPSQQAVGLAACDAVQGQFTLSTSTNQLVISQLSVTKGSCTSPVFGPRYLAALPQTSRYAISHDTLRLYDLQQATPRLVFKAAP